MCGRPQLSHWAIPDESDKSIQIIRQLTRNHLTDNAKKQNPRYCSDDKSSWTDKTHVWWCGLVCGKIRVLSSARRTSTKMSRARSIYMCCKNFLVQTLKDVSLAHRRNFDSSGKKFKRTGSVHGGPRYGRPVTMANEEIATIMRGQLVVSPNMSKRKSDNREAMRRWNV